jgi:hypothetical protein
MKALFLGLLVVAGSACADDAAILRCRALTEGSGRLACYDAIPVGAVAASAAPAAMSPANGVPAAGMPATASAPAVAAAPTRAQQEQNFGMEAKAAPAAPINSIESAIDGDFSGWGPGTMIKLANGQTWRVIDDSESYLSLHNPKVAITRGLLGAMFMEIEGSRRAPKVQRVQ